MTADSTKDPKLNVKKIAIEMLNILKEKLFLCVCISLEQSQ